ncbi:MAG: hypothetical protein CMH81_04860 [Nitrospiraceae bacterium]|nr:hypothetical protein [Nitrospiraceae bacterium]|tara:strand:+ start:2674 stop:3546 length:873 start_codon:yes stop_codon:yes gene_type:complete
MSTRHVMSQQHPSPPFTLTVQESERMLFITGIPRSGTSLLAHLLDHLPNLAILNEPRELPFLFETPSLEGFFSSYKTWRTKIANGEAIENQCVDNMVVSDTWNDGERRLYRPLVTREDFVLGTKNPLAYLTQLMTIRRVFPGAKIVILVRHPYYTIGSWKKTFSHLRHATILNSAVFKFADERQRAILLKLAAVADESTRRAGLWNYLATEIIMCADFDTIIRYEDLIVDPLPHLQRIYQQFFPDQMIGSVKPLVSRNNEEERCAMSIEEKKCIESMCAASAAWFGYHDL